MKLYMKNKIKKIISNKKTRNKRMWTKFERLKN